MGAQRMQNGARFEGWPLERDKTGRQAPSDLAGLRNQVRLIRRVAEAGDLREVQLGLDALLDDLSNTRVCFSWSGGAAEQKRMDSKAATAKQEEKAAQHAGVAAYCHENPGLVD
jgi:hypothetical protein